MLRISKYRPEMPLLGLTPQDTTRRRTALMWGTESMLVPMKDSGMDLTTAAERALVDGGWASQGDQVVIVSGRPGGHGGTNRIMVHKIGEEAWS